MLDQNKTRIERVQISLNREKKATLCFCGFTTQSIGIYGLERSYRSRYI